MANPHNQSVIPQGYTFLPPGHIFVSEKTKKMLLDELTEQAEKRNPDANDMYIYNDFFAEALLDLIDSVISTINKHFKKKEWDEVIFCLEALCLFMNNYSEWGMYEDSDRVCLTNTMIGAFVVSTLRALKADNRLNTTSFPSLETLLREAAGLGKMVRTIGGDSDYDLVCKSIGYRLFNDNVEERKAVLKAREKAWLDGLGDKERKEMQEMRGDEPDDDDAGAKKGAEKGDSGEDEDEDMDEDEDGWESDSDSDECGKAKQPWYHKGNQYREDTKDTDFTVSRVWKEYRDCLREACTVPRRGPADWDLSTWTEKEKKPFLFSSMDNDDD